MAKPGADKEKERKKLAKIIEEKNDIAKDMQEAQRKFAAANNFLIEKKWSLKVTPLILDTPFYQRLIGEERDK